LPFKNIKLAELIILSYFHSSFKSEKLFFLLSEFPADFSTLKAVVIELS